MRLDIRHATVENLRHNHAATLRDNEDFMKVAVTTSTFAQYSPEPLELLRAAGYEVVLNPHGRALTEDEAVEVLRGCVGVVAGTEPLTAGVMAALPELRAISRCGTGMDSVDKEAAAARGIAVRNTPDAPTRAVVELTVGFALDLVRGISRMDRDIRAGVWKKRMGNLIHGKTVGIIGYGRIGRAVGAAFAALGCPAVFFDPFVTDVPAGTERLELAALLERADIVTLHCAKPKDGAAVLDAAALGRMKPGALVINAARGGLVDEEALCALLESGKLGGAALDVFGREPYDGPLARLENTVLTPHIGSYALEARVNMEVEAARNLLEALA